MLDVPVEVCPACGQVWLSMPVAKRLDDLFDQSLPAERKVLSSTGRAWPLPEVSASDAAAVPLAHLDAQLASTSLQSDHLGTPRAEFDRLASGIFSEVRNTTEAEKKSIRQLVPIPPEAYRDEMQSFQSWVDIAHSNHNNPFVVRAQVMTELYGSFVWLRDSFMKPIADVLPNSLHAKVTEFLLSDERRRLRNAIAHGRWTYRRDFDGLDCWDGRPPQHLEVSDEELTAWQTLSRADAIAVLLGLTE